MEFAIFRAEPYAGTIGPNVATILAKIQRPAELQPFRKRGTNSPIQYLRERNRDLLCEKPPSAVGVTGSASWRGEMFEAMCPSDFIDLEFVGRRYAYFASQRCTLKSIFVRGSFLVQSSSHRSAMPWRRCLPFLVQLVSSTDRLTLHTYRRAWPWYG